MPLGVDYADQDCSLARALEVVGERWTMLVLRDLFFGVRRHRDLLAHLDISRAVLSARLDTLVRAGVVERDAGSGHPTYTLTARGLALWPALFALVQWGDEHASPDGPRRLFEHAGCGPLDRTGRCRACGSVPAPGDVSTLPAPGVRRRRQDPVSRALATEHRLLEPVTG